MPPFFDIHLTISSIHGKISFEFRFWAHFFASRNPDTRSKIFRTALKKFALRADENVKFVSIVLLLKLTAALEAYSSVYHRYRAYGKHVRILYIQGGF